MNDLLDRANISSGKTLPFNVKIKAYLYELRINTPYILLCYIELSDYALILSYRSNLKNIGQQKRIENLKLFFKVNNVFFYHEIEEECRGLVF